MKYFRKSVDLLASINTTANWHTNCSPYCLVRNGQISTPSPKVGAILAQRKCYLIVQEFGAFFLANCISKQTVQVCLSSVSSLHHRPWVHTPSASSARELSLQYPAWCQHLRHDTAVSWYGRWGYHTRDWENTWKTSARIVDNESECLLNTRPESYYCLAVHLKVLCLHSVQKSQKNHKKSVRTANPVGLRVLSTVLKWTCRHSVVHIPVAISSCPYYVQEISPIFHLKSSVREISATSQQLMLTFCVF
jgi:hypothetical protein